MNDTLSREKSKKEFLKRMFLYRLQKVLAALIAIIGAFVYGLLMLEMKVNPNSNSFFIIILLVTISSYNTTTYLCSKYLTTKYGINMFDDLDQAWLKEHQGYGAANFGEIFSRAIQCRKIAGPCLLFVVTLLTCINVTLASIIGILYVIGYCIYYNTYFIDAIGDKVPRVFGNSNIVSRVIDNKNQNLDVPNERKRSN